MVACADIAPENAREYAETFGIGKTYLDYNDMLAQENLDVVSVCTWMHLHEPMALDAIAAGVKAIHCEKPMAPTWGESLKMAAACEKAGIQLTFGHQRRFLKAFRTAKELVARRKAWKNPSRGWRRWRAP